MPLENETARRRLRSKARLEIVPGATHLFEEAGILQQAARLACQWFQEHLAPPSDDRKHPENSAPPETDPHRG
jgi:putative phosphoribosyl transferase